ncbi:hypothetical protein BGZ63DRAFT_352769 [Mariannaea sp. PMI_226]|nr:hypothetical protein BGZ63DRAFT_352769 [Mariannaea sp. PMI_226]
MASTLTVAKQQLRALMKQTLSNVAPESVNAQSRQVFEALKNFQPYKEANRISVYLSMPAAEIQTDAIVRHALASGKQVYVPYLYKSSLEIPGAPTRVMDMVHLESLHDYENLKPDRWGIPSIDPDTVHQRQRILEPTGFGGSVQTALDLIVVPGVAFDFDDAGHVRRLGHGKGFYDYFLNRYFSRMEIHDHPQHKPLLLYGLALNEQIIPPSWEQPVPTASHDRPLHGLIIGSGEVKNSTDSPAIQK